MEISKVSNFSLPLNRDSVDPRFTQGGRGGPPPQFHVNNGGYNQPPPVAYNNNHVNNNMSMSTLAPAHHTQQQAHQQQQPMHPQGHGSILGVGHGGPMPVPLAGGVTPNFPPHPPSNNAMAYNNNNNRMMPQQQPPMMMMPYQQRINITELVQVPAELASFASDPKFQQILLKVKEQTMINFISLNRTSTDSVESVSIDAPSKESAQLARGLIETHFKLQSKLKQSEARLQKVQGDLFSAQGEIASGMMIEFTIDPELVGLALGKKGMRIKQIEHDTKVHSINVTGETGTLLCLTDCHISVSHLFV